MARRTIALGLFALLPLSGCTVGGVLWHNAFGDPPVAAQYEPPKRPTLVLVENFREPGETQADADLVARKVGDELKDKGGFQIIDPDKLVPLREEDPAGYRKLSAVEVAKAVGAKQVVYVDLLEVDTGADASGGSVHSKLTARVSVLDVEKDKTLWPTTSTGGTELSAKQEYQRYDAPGAASMRADTLAQLSSRVAKLFYTWKPDNSEEERAGG